MSAHEKMAAVIVLYQKNLIETESFQSILKDLDIPILVYDNSPLQQEVLQKNNIEYYHNPANPGVSEAYNYAAKWAGEKTCTHLLLLDSDSSFSEGAFENYKKAVKKNPDELILPQVMSSGFKISTFYFKYGKSFYGDKIPVGTIELKQLAAINSGMLIPLKWFKALGGYSTHLPLDWSDIEFVRRFAKKKKTAIHIPLVIQHGLSEHQQESIESAKRRYGIYLRGIKNVSTSFTEYLLMLLWAKLKAIKLCFKYKTTWFLFHYALNFYA